MSRAWASPGACARAFLLSCLVSLFTACGDEPPPVRTGPASDAFAELSRVALEDSPIATIGQMHDFLPFGDGFLVADGMSNRVLSFSAQGTFLRAVGRGGDGPGEFETPRSLLVDRDSTILVTDLSARLTRLSPKLAVLNVYRVDVPVWVTQMVWVQDRIVLSQPSGRTAVDNFIEWNAEQGLGRSFDRINERYSTIPYWNAAWHTLLAVGATELYVADNMVYPLRRLNFDGELVDTFGVAPPSWRQAEKLEHGQFATPEGQRKGLGWLRSFTLIAGVHVVGGDWLVVTHREPVGQYPTDDIIRADVYDAASLRKVWQDIQLPGRVVRGGSCAWVIVTEPPDSWTLACWVPKRPAGAE